MTQLDRRMFITLLSIEDFFLLWKDIHKVFSAYEDQPWFNEDDFADWVEALEDVAKIRGVELDYS